MTLSASMWTSVSGLLAHGDKMNVVGNNIANVSTIGFKGQRMDFNDYLYIDRGSTSGPTQIGEGVSIYAVLGDFSQGAFESTNSGTDIAIDGNGFFGVRRPNSKTLYYTRAGDFYFNKDRELVNPEGYHVQGLRVDNTKQLVFYTGAAVRASKDESPWVGQGSPTDIILDSWNLIPQRTTNVSVTNQLINEVIYDKAVDYTDPMCSLYKLWDANQTQKVPPDPPLPQQAYATQSSLKVYDESGVEHEMTIYFDKVNTPVYDNATPPNLVYELQGLPAGYQVYEYLVTVPPSEDMRSYGGTYNPATNTVTGGTPFYDPAGTNTSQKAGILMTGVLVFNAAGQLVNQTAYTYGGQYNGAANVNDQCPADPDLMASWQPTRFSSNGLPVLAANFTGQPLANSVGEMMQGTGGPPPYSQAEQHIIEIDFGLTNAGGSWNNLTPTRSLADLAVVTLPGPLPVVDYTNNAATMASAVRDQDATANNGTQFISDAQQDGYPSGVLSGYNIDTNGVLYGRYDNNVTLALWQMTLYDFRNLQGLRREGGNLYSQTMESGNARWSIPGNAGFGSTQAYNIEQSNVDMAREFVQMISTQRGFQANSKGISTVDTMLETVIGMKR
ncbi:MAG: flagellar hook-basal body complex protein [Desulfovibrio sp.]|nr:flagellar hook-basal body complex protein [Desulfovibrio sp.]